MNTIDAKARLESEVQKNLPNTMAVVERVLGSVPQDAIVRAQALTFAASPEGADPSHPLFAMTTGEHTWSMHRNALGQVATAASVPMDYVGKLLEGSGWQRDMLADILNETFNHSSRRHLVRSVGKEARGFLSDSFRRLDSRPIMEAFVQQVQAAGAVPLSAHSNDIRMSIKAIVPRIRELPVPAHGTHQRVNEALAFGIELSNSDYGAGGLSIRTFLLRLVCLNGATRRT
jgi:hypothetical protein